MNDFISLFQFLVSVSDQRLRAIITYYWVIYTFYKEYDKVDTYFVRNMVIRITNLVLDLHSHDVLSRMIARTSNVFHPVPTANFARIHPAFDLPKLIDQLKWYKPKFTIS